MSWPKCQRQREPLFFFATCRDSETGAELAPPPLSPLNPPGWNPLKNHCANYPARANPAAESHGRALFSTMSSQRREPRLFFCSRVHPPVGEGALCPPSRMVFQFDRVQLRHPRGKVISRPHCDTPTDELAMRQRNVIAALCVIQPRPPSPSSKRLVNTGLWCNLGNE